MRLGHDDDGGPDDCPAEQFERRQVEVERRVVGDAIGGGEPEGRRCDGCVGKGGPMRVHDPLGASRRAGREDDVGEVVATHGYVGRCVGSCPDLLPVDACNGGIAVGDTDAQLEPNLGGQGRNRRALRAARHDVPYLAVFEDVANVRRRSVGVDGNVGRPRLHDTVHGDEELDRLVGEEPNAIAALHAVPPQQVRDRIGASIQFAVGQCRTEHRDRGMIWAAPCRGGNGLRDGGKSSSVRRRVHRPRILAMRSRWISDVPA